MIRQLLLISIRAHKFFHLIILIQKFLSFTLRFFLLVAIFLPLNFYSRLHPFCVDFPSNLYLIFFSRFRIRLHYFLSYFTNKSTGFFNLVKLKIIHFPFYFWNPYTTFSIIQQFFQIILFFFKNFYKNFQLLQLI